MELQGNRQVVEAAAGFLPHFHQHRVAMSFLDRLFRRSDPRESLQPLYAAVVARGRDMHWYVAGAVPDTLDGRFDMIAAILSLVLLRLEKGGMNQEGVWLTELFVDDMDGQLRQSGVGDVVVGKHIGRMMSALGGRLTAYRAAFAGEADLGEALARNLYRGAAVDPAALVHATASLQAFGDGLAHCDTTELLAGRLPVESAAA
jgi:cytochrome b pre-mRNA-processing protein 3